MRAMAWAAALLLLVCRTALAGGGFSPAAPVNLAYTLPAAMEAGQAADINLTVTTPMTSGELVVEIARSAGVTLQCSRLQRFDLGATPSPVAVTLEVVPSAAAERFLVLEITVDTPAGPLSRNFRITLPGDAGGVQPQQSFQRRRDGMVILPAESSP